MTTTLLCADHIWHRTISTVRHKNHCQFLQGTVQTYKRGVVGSTWHCVCFKSSGVCFSQ